MNTPRKALFSVFIVVLSLLSAHSSRGMEKSRFELSATAGFNRSRLVPDNMVTNFGPFDQPAARFSGGINALYRLGAGWGIRTGLHYSLAGAQTGPQVGTDETGHEKGQFWFSRRLQFVEVPVHIVYRFDAGKIRPSLYFGPNIGFLFKARETLESDYGEEKYETDIKSKLNPVNLSAELGFGMSYRLNGRWALGISSSYLHGLTNQIKARTEGEQKTRDLRLLGSLIYVMQ